jgi:hypothetical protein
LKNWLKENVSGNKINVKENKELLPYNIATARSFTVPVTRQGANATLTINANNLTAITDPAVVVTNQRGNLVVGEAGNAVFDVQVVNWPTSTAVTLNNASVTGLNGLTVTGTVNFVTDGTGRNTYIGTGEMNIAVQAGNTLPAGTHNLTLTVTGVAGQFPIVVVPAGQPGQAPVVSAQSRSVTQNVAGLHNIGAPLTATNGPTAWEIQNRPAWINISNTGQLFVPAGQNAPAATASPVTIQVRAENAYGWSAYATITITIVAEAPAVVIHDRGVVPGTSLRHLEIEVTNITSVHRASVQIIGAGATTVWTPFTFNTSGSQDVFVEAGSAGAQTVLVLLSEGSGLPPELGGTAIVVAFARWDRP